MRACGYEPKTVAFVWVKRIKDGGDAVGNGWWTRANTEVCLLGTRGRVRRHDSTEARSVRQLLVEDASVEDLALEVLASVRGRHSQKPVEFRRRVEVLMGPSATRLELYARERADGWDAHGDQVPGGADVVLVDGGDGRQLAIAGVAP